MFNERCRCCCSEDNTESVRVNQLSDTFGLQDRRRLLRVCRPQLTDDCSSIKLSNHECNQKNLSRMRNNRFIFCAIFLMHCPVKSIFYLSFSNCTTENSFVIWNVGSGTGHKKPVLIFTPTPAQNSAFKVNTCCHHVPLKHTVLICVNYDILWYTMQFFFYFWIDHLLNLSSYCCYTCQVLHLQIWSLQ